MDSGDFATGLITDAFVRVSLSQHKDKRGEYLNEIRSLIYQGLRLAKSAKSAKILRLMKAHLNRLRLSALL